MKTIDQIKGRRKVPETLKEKVKNDGKINRAILKTITDGPKTIPRIAEEINMQPHIVTYYLMTLLKYGKVEVGEIDDMDEYYNYNIKK
ncbi:MAG: hypothetical protein R6T99_03170 [Bacteroidales bacterium]